MYLYLEEKRKKNLYKITIINFKEEGERKEKKEENELLTFNFD